MANANGEGTGLRAGAERLRKEGERFAARIDKDVRAFTKRTRAELAADVRELETTLRGRLVDTLRAVEKRSARVVGRVDKRIAVAAEDVLKHLHAATRSDVAALARRVTALEANDAARIRVVGSSVS